MFFSLVATAIEAAGLLSQFTPVVVLGGRNYASALAAPQLHALGLPIVAASTARDTMWGPTIPELAEVIGQANVIDRSTVNAWNDPRIREAITATGRSKLVIAGIATEVCAALPAISAVSDGYDAYVAVDASGSFSQTRRDTALLRMHQAGVIPVDFASAMIEILADNASPLAEDLYTAIDIPFARLVTGLTHAAA